MLQLLWSLAHQMFSLRGILEVEISNKDENSMDNNLFTSLERRFNTGPCIVVKLNVQLRTKKTK